MGEMGGLRGKLSGSPLAFIFRTGQKYKSFSSPEWLKRRNADEYITKAKRENYRCRSAYKLLEIDDKYNLLRAGQTVLDVGAAPGSWSQVLADRTNSNGKDKTRSRGIVVAIDLSFIHPIEGVTVLPKQDFTSTLSQENILKVLDKKKLDFVFSDMAPPATGVKSLDQSAIISLAFPVLVFAVKHLNLGGGCLIKIWEGKHTEMADNVKKFFRTMNYVKPSATYSSSSELYLLGRDFLGLKK